MKKKRIFKETLVEELVLKGDNANELYSVDDPAGILKENKLDFNKAKHHQASEKIRTTNTANTNAAKRGDNVESLKKIIIDEYGGLAALENKKILKDIYKDASKRLGVDRRSINTYLRIIKNEAGGSNAAFSDIALCTLIRNGVEVPE